MSANLIQLFDSLQEIPEEFRKATPLLDLQAPPRSALNNKEFEAMYANSIRAFNKIQTQVFQALYTLDKNDFIGASMGRRGFVRSLH
jgi:pre-mRNA-splicing helicase BRR2